jgi:hypothetical protein
MSKRTTAKTGDIRAIRVSGVGRAMMNQQVVHHERLAAELDIPVEEVIRLANEWSQDGYDSYDEQTGLMTRACATAIRAYINTTAR